jgi:hypothetical protein
MMIKYDTEHEDVPGKPLNDKREVYQFTEREKNETLLKKIGNMFAKEFIPFDVPKGWEVNKIPYAPPATERIRAANANPIGNPATNPNRGPANIGNPNNAAPNTGNPAGNPSAPNGRAPIVPLQGSAPTQPRR